MKKNLLLGVVAIVLATVAGVGLLSANNSADASLAMTELSVKKLTCGACVANINEALSKVAGVNSIDVSVTTGRSQVMFDPAKVDAAHIAQVISDSGYPTTVLRELSAEQYQALQSEAAQLAEIYVAKIGDQLLARDEFNRQVEQRLLADGLQQRPEMRPQVVSQTFQSLKQRMLLLQAADRNQVVVQPGEVDLRIEQMSKQLPNFEAYVQNRFGSQEAFYSQTKEDMIINKNIQENVLAGVKEPAQRQARFNQWFQELIRTAPVTIYDANLKQTKSGGGCGSGGGCC